MSDMYCGGHGLALPCSECAANLKRRHERDALLQPKAGEPTAEMVEAYLEAQKEAIDRFDSFVNIGGRHRDHIREACKAGLRAALPRAAPPVGMVSVPLEPTEEMTDAGVKAWDVRYARMSDAVEGIWRAMLEAAK